MIGIEKFPKFLHGVRYSVDYAVTQMTTKFFVFDWLLQLNNMQTSENDNSYLKNKIFIYSKCIIANTLATILSQSSFNYQVLASSLPIDAKNRNEDVRQKLMQYSKNKKVPFIGLKYTVPVSIYNTILQMFLIEKMNKFFVKN